jgi:hypothetical protein
VGPLSAEVVRGLSGIHTETSAVFNLTTQFGGGKTHFLTMLYHLARQEARGGCWMQLQRPTLLSPSPRSRAGAGSSMHNAQVNSGRRRRTVSSRCR